MLFRVRLTETGPLSNKLQISFGNSNYKEKRNNNQTNINFKNSNIKANILMIKNYTVNIKQKQLRGPCTSTTLNKGFRNMSHVYTLKHVSL